MKTNLNPPAIMYALCEVIDVYPDGRSHISFFNPKTDRINHIFNFNHNKLLSKRDLNKYPITQGTLFGWYKKTYVFLNKKYVYDYFKVKKIVCLLSDEDIKRICDEAYHLSELLKDR